MESLDFDFLFTNIPLKGTIDIWTNRLFENTEKVEGLSKIEFEELLSLATKESYFVINGKFYKQVDGVAMVSPSVPTLVNASLVYFENNTFWCLCFIYLTKTFRSLPKFSKCSTC